MRIIGHEKPRNVSPAIHLKRQTTIRRTCFNEKGTDFFLISGVIKGSGDEKCSK